MAEELNEALERLLATEIASISRRPYIYGTSFALDELGVTTTGGAELRLLMKDLGTSSFRQRAAKPAFLYDPLREIAVYEEILAETRMGTARCYGTVADPARDRYWLFLEHVDGRPLWQIGEMELWTEAARWLARLHTECREVTHERLVRCDRAYYETWLGRARAANHGERFERVASAYEQAIDVLANLPATLIHNEFYSENVLVETNGHGVRVCPVDWETTARGPALLDLAALVSGEWPAEHRREMVEAYNDALPVPYPPDELDPALDCCRLHIAVHWLGFNEDGRASASFVEEWTQAAEAAIAGP